LQQIGSFDLRVLKNEKAWPRAFFADRVLAYDTTEEFLQMIRKGTGSPLAAVQRSDTAALSATHEFQAGDGASHLVVPAKDFSLTSNNTTFVVDAPGPGVIVLTETYPDDEDFRATLNGTPTKYFRVNHAFRGVTVPAAGSYTISFSYWPKHFTLSLMMFGAGLVLLLGWLGTTLMLLPRQGRGRLLTENSRSGAGPGN
jgi:hypothetical protein